MPFRYAALESLLHDYYTVESELWAFGIVLWELFTFAQRPPYAAELPDCSTAQLAEFLIDGGRLTPPDTAPISM
jgi:hypothetical protein